MVNQADWPERRLVGLLVATGAVMLTAGVLIGRYVVPASGTAGPQGQADSRVDVRPTGAASASTATTVVPEPTGAATGSPQIQPPTQTSQVPGMPTRVNEFGIPVGYPHTEAGAISACGNYVAAYMATPNREPSRIKSILDSISETSIANRLADQIIDVDKRNATSFDAASINDPKISFNSRVLGYEVQQKSQNTVTVSIWSTTSFGSYDSAAANTRPQVRWGTDICTVHWSENDWKVANVSDGPGGPIITERTAEGYQRFAYVGGPGS